jgi:hypothetical protein
MNSKLKSIITKIFYYVYAFLLFAFAISILMLMGYLGMKKTIDWNGALILYGILIPALIIFRMISRKLKEKNVG